MTGAGVSRAAYGFPWGANTPTRRQRAAVATLIASIAALFAAAEYAGNVGHHSDFGQVWFGARTLLAGGNPWTLVGPGLAFDWGWPLLYPAPALIIAMPFAWLTESVATSAFVGTSTLLLAWGATRDSWHRLPAFASLPFLVSSSAGQWSALIASSWFVPAAAMAWSAKPTLGLVMLVSSRSRRAVASGVLAGIVLILVSFALLDSWAASWATALSSASHMRPPITHWGGFAIAASALRWRRPEARLLLALALVPQSPAVYDLLLILVIIPATYREAVALSLFCTVGLLALQLAPESDLESFVRMRGLITVASTYLPATAMVLRRPNNDDVAHG